MSKTKPTYELTECIISVNETESITSYGVKCLEGTQVVKEIQDISPNKPAVEKLIKLFNRSSLSLVHLEDVIEDKLDELI